MLNLLSLRHSPPKNSTSWLALSRSPLDFEESGFSVNVWLESSGIYSFVVGDRRTEAGSDNLKRHC